MSSLGRPSWRQHGGLLDPCGDGVGAACRRRWPPARQPALVKHAVGARAALDHAVGVEDERVARLERHGAVLEVGVRDDAEEGARRADRLDAAVHAQQQGKRMAAGRDAHAGAVGRASRGRRRPRCRSGGRRAGGAGPRSAWRGCGSEAARASPRRAACSGRGRSPRRRPGPCRTRRPSPPSSRACRVSNRS